MYYLLRFLANCGKEITFFWLYKEENSWNIKIRRENKGRRINWSWSKFGWTLNRRRKNQVFSDETSNVVDENNRIYFKRRADEVFRPKWLGLLCNRTYSAMFLDCISHNGIRTFTKFERIINSRKYIDILDENMWSVLAMRSRDNATVHTANKLKRWKTISNF